MAIDDVSRHESFTKVYQRRTRVTNKKRKQNNLKYPTREAHDTSVFVLCMYVADLKNVLLKPDMLQIYSQTLQSQI